MNVLITTEKTQRMENDLDFPLMTERVQTMVRESLKALQKVMMRDTSTVKRAVHTLSSSRHLERIADHATNIAEGVVFLVDGELIRHRTEDYLESSSG